jgi:hypothetical protein
LTKYTTPEKKIVLPPCSNSRHGKSALDGCEQVLLTFYSVCHYANFVPKD